MTEQKNLSKDVVEVKPGIFTIKLGENLQGGSEALDFSNQLYNCKDAGAKCVIVELKYVKMMNSSGLGMLVSGLTTLKKNDIKMVLTDVPEKIQKLLEMTHLVEVFTIIGTVEEAVENYK